MSDLYCFVHSLGHCYTYNPPEDGLPSFEGGVGLFLGRAANDPPVFTRPYQGLLLVESTY